MDLKCTMLATLKRYICYDSPSTSFSKRGDYRNRKPPPWSSPDPGGSGWGVLTRRGTREFGGIIGGTS